ncbi:hypothetical protein [Acidicapsa acidisoli]|uniref:hypothetical protein n=1 Tax=Acidicapsa acidisoli TaxID=1615681 RepID=UPI0021E0F3C4|nr:hypothetical protein [Acidicapsa acidisoli]
MINNMIALALFTVVGPFSSGDAPALSSPAAHYQTAQYAVPPVPVMTVCNVNGVDYQVDYSYQIWGVNAFGNWFVIGRIVRTAYGTIAIRTDGVRYPAAC